MRLIDADELLDRMESRCNLCPHNDNWRNCRRECEWHEAIDEIEDSSDVYYPLVKSGRWKGWTKTYWTGRYDNNEDPEYKACRYYACSECGGKTVVQSHYCPFCGAKMDREKAGES